MLLFKVSSAQVTIDPDACHNAILISDLSNWCTGNGQNSTSSTNPAQWFKFVATAYDVNIRVEGGTLHNPQIQLFLNCEGNGVVGNSTTINNVTNFYKGGLVIGQTYYILVSSGNNQPGTFTLCINNYTPTVQPGHDCATAAYLCSTETISAQNIVGAGNNANEAAGTCLDVPGTNSEQNSIWYKWKAANNGNLLFTLIPNNPTDDLDFVIYDLGTSDDCANIDAAHAVRCAAGSGVKDAELCPGSTGYYKTGLDLTATDISESSGCGQGQDGKLKYLPMIAGHFYALLINNFSSNNSGLTLEFKDQNGVAGDAKFAGPEAAFTTTPATTARLSPPVNIHFYNSSVDATRYLWDFGDGQTSTDTSPTHTFTTNGNFKVTLTAFNDKSCSTSVSIGDYMLSSSESIFIPNTFTPNGDGINDVFNVLLTNINKYHLYIYNRWGKLLFQSQSQQISWDGTYDGQQVPAGVYYYILNAQNYDQKDARYSGYVTVLR